MASGPGDAAAPSRALVMLIDDEVDNLDVMTRMLRAKFEVDAFSSPLRAMEAMPRRPYSVILSDHRMPEATGITVLSFALQQAPDAQRILVTAFADLSVALDAVNKARVSAILCKPVSADQLLKEVERCSAFVQTIQRLRHHVSEVSRTNQEIGETLEKLKRR